MKGARPIVVVYNPSSARYLNGKLTVPVLIICTAVAFAGFMFGYDMGVAGALSGTETFLKKFFPSPARKNNTNQDQFCALKPPGLVTYLSSIYFAGIFSALLAGRLTTTAGRKGALVIGGIIFLIGASLQAIAVAREMLILGRILVGFGLGFTNQAAPIYLTEIAPTKWRGAIGTGFYLFFGIGVYLGSWTCYLLSSLGENSWRLAISISAFPAIIMVIVAFYMPDTPCSLIQRGKVQEALQSLNQVRSVETDDVNSELQYLIKYHETMKNASEKPYQMLLERKYRPQVVVAVALSSFQLLTGIAVQGNFGPVIDRTISMTYKSISSISLILGVIVFLSTFAASYAIDRYGRRILLTQAGIQMFICQLTIAISVVPGIGKKECIGFTLKSALVARIANIINALAYSWSWGPITWIVSTEILPMEVRAAGQGLSVAFNFLFQFMTIQTMFPMFCYLKYGTFLFYGGWILIMTIFVIFFMPETKRISLESMDIIWRSHWYWHQFVDGTGVKSEIS